MCDIKPERLVQAAKTAIALITALHETIWSLYPDELIALADEPEQQLIALITQAQKPSKNLSH